MIRTIAQLRGSICGTQLGTYNYYDVITKTYENTEVIFIFEKNYNGIISITDTRETYAIYKTELISRIINESENMDAYFYEGFIPGLWRGVLIKEPKFMPNRYYKDMILAKKNMEDTLSYNKENFKKKLIKLMNDF